MKETNITLCCSAAVLNVYPCIYRYIYMCVCVCVCVSTANMVTRGALLLPRGRSEKNRKLRGR